MHQIALLTDYYKCENISLISGETRFDSDTMKILEKNASLCLKVIYPHCLSPWRSLLMQCLLNVKYVFTQEFTMALCFQVLWGTTHHMLHYTQKSLFFK